MYIRFSYEYFIPSPMLREVITEPIVNEYTAAMLYEDSNLSGRSSSPQSSSSKKVINCESFYRCIVSVFFYFFYHFYCLDVL